MALETKTIPEKEAEILSDVDAALGQTTPESEIAYNRTWGRTIAGLSKIFDKLVEVAVKSILLSTSRDETILQNDWSVWTKTARKLKTQARLNVEGTGVPLDIIPGGINATRYVSEDGQAFYFISNYEVPATGIVATELIAFTPGPQANLIKGDLSITAQNSSISDILTIKISDPIAVAGTETESIDSWKSEMQRVAKKPVTSDNNSFYYSTSRQRPNIISGYFYTDVPGQGELYIESDSSDGVPTADQIADNEAWFQGDIDGTVRLPADMEGNVPDDATTPRFVVKASFQTAFDTVITGLDPATTANEAAITAAVQLYFATRKPYVKGVSIENDGVISQNGLRSVVQTEIEKIGANSFTDATMTKVSDGLPYIEYPLGRGERSNSNTPSYV